MRSGTFAIVINPNKERCEAAKFQNYGETMTLPLDATRFLRCNRSSSQLIPTQHDTRPWITGRLGLGAPEHLSGRVLCRGGPAPPPAPPPAPASSHAAPPLGSPGNHWKAGERGLIGFDLGVSGVKPLPENVTRPKSVCPPQLPEHEWGLQRAVPPSRVLRGAPCGRRWARCCERWRRSNILSRPSRA